MNIFELVSHFDIICLLIAGTFDLTRIKIHKRFFVRHSKNVLFFIGGEFIV